MSYRTGQPLMHGLKSQSQSLALEPRVMFDGAAGVAVDQHHADAAHPAHPDQAAAHPQATEARAPTTPAPSAARELLVIDSRIQGKEQLLAGLPSNVTAVVVDTQQDGLAVISQALSQLGRVDSIQILSHGSPGQMILGDRVLRSDNIDQFAATLESWHANLAPGADILIYGCNVAQGSSGQYLVQELAHWTGADVAASTDNTGSADAGGNWTLEYHDGVIDHALALSPAAIDGFHGLLVDASPTVSLSSAGSDVLLGGQFTFTATFRNTSTQVGYAPYIDLVMPATGKDGDDGATFVSATYLGNPVTAYVLTFDANGQAIHPLAKDTSGNPLVVNASTFGARAGDQLVVLQLPYASVTNGQPAIDVQITAHLSNLADTAYSNGAPDLNLSARGGFQFGNDPISNPTIDPTLVETALHSYVVHPTVITVTESIDVTDGKTATGPNYPHNATMIATTANGQTLSNVKLTQTVSPDVIVTAITPAAGGVVTSITLPGGTVVTDPAQIAALFSAGTYLQSYTVEYATLTNSANTVVSFYVAEQDANGNQVIDPATGQSVPITFSGAQASGQWVPLDPRDLVPPATTIDWSGTGQGATFLAQSISMIKRMTLQTDLGSVGLTPGDTLSYVIEMDLSDYFTFGRNLLGEGQFFVRDVAGDGQTVTGTPTLTIQLNGSSTTIPLVTTTVVNPDGSTSLVFDIAQSLFNASGLLGILQGDLALDNTRSGATKALISYTTVVSQAYTTAYAQSEINEGDSVGNNATVTATVVEDLLNNGGNVQDNDSATLTVPTGNVDIAIVAVNGGAPPSNGELRPGDVVTFSLSYNLTTGDYEQLVLSGYLPLELLDVSGITWTQGTGAGHWQFGPSNTNGDTTVTVTSGSGNAVNFDFGSYAVNSTVGSRIEVRFTVVVGPQPFADQRSLTVLGQSSQVTTIDHTPLLSSDAVIIESIAEPDLTLIHGVVSTTNGTITGTTGTWTAPGSIGRPFSGIVTDPNSANGDITGIDGGDLLRMATVIKNSGGGAAFDVTSDITLPGGVTFIGGSLAAANLRVYRGDGTLMVLNTDYSITGNTITFLDPGGIGSVTGGRAGSQADLNGSNVVVITYDVTVDSAIAASSTLQSAAALLRYASVDNGNNFTSGQTELAGEQVAAPTVKVVYAGGTLDNSDSSASHTNGSDLVIGESMLYDIVVTLPEGTTRTLRLDDLIPAGLRLDTSFNGRGFEIILSASESAALSADFAGNISTTTITGTNGNLGDDGVGARITFNISSATADNNTGNNTFVIRVRLVASNVLSNQAGKVLSNNAQLVYSDPDGDTPNGAVAIDRAVAAPSPTPTITIREPTLIITQTTDPLPPLGVDETIPVTYQIVIRNGGATSDFNAYDISFQDALPTQMDNFTILGVLYTGGATANGGQDFVIVNGVLRTANNANIDIPVGGSITIRVTGIVNDTAAQVPSFTNTATVQWTSLDGSVNGERTGVDGPLNSGVLNDYQASSSITVPVLRGVYISRVGGLPDTAPADPTYGPDENVTIGEIVHYRAVGVFAQGVTNDFILRIALPSGLGYINDGTMRISFISNGGLFTDVTLATSGNFNIFGDESNPIAQPLDPNLSGRLADGVINPNQVEVQVDGNGNTILVIHMGNITNTENDTDYELFSLEFNAVVRNVATNVAGTQLGVFATEYTGTTQLFTSTTVNEDIVEPNFGSLNKQIVDFVPNTTATTGTASVSVSFVQTGSNPAYDVLLTDSFTGASGYTFSSLIINGTAYTAGNLPPGVTIDFSNGVVVRFAQLNPNDQVHLLYDATVPNTSAIPGNNATLTWTSLPASFTNWGGSSVGAAGTSVGERTGAGALPNTYILSDGAGLGVISGTLWDDTNSATSSATPDGPGLAGQTVTLTWAGLDGNLATTTDNKVFTTITDANGQYQFGALPSGVFRIDTPVGPVSYPQPLGDLRVRIDTDANSPLGQVVVNLGEGVVGAANAGYVHQNVAPVNSLPGQQHGLEDIALPIPGISVFDIDAGTRNISVTLTVLNGTLTAGATTGVTMTGNGTAKLVLTGSQDAINQALATLSYLGNQDWNGTDTLTVVTNDLGSFGDVNGNGTPGENPGDALTDTDSLAIVLDPVNDPPTAFPDSANALEAGGTLNGTPGTNPRGNVLANDQDVDIATNGDHLEVTTIALVGGTAGTQNVVAGTPTVVIGRYGTLYINRDGSYQYVVDNNNATVQALRLDTDTLVEQFNYQAIDTGNLGTGSTLTVTIHGANDAPVAVLDQGTAIEKGGVLNGSGGQDATGNVLDNDTDVESASPGETKTVVLAHSGGENVSGGFIAVPPSNPSDPGVLVQGLYGALYIKQDGSYVYVVDDNNATVQQLMAGENIVDTFSYVVQDTGGLRDIAELRITIQGANDNPVATPDVAQAQAAATNDDSLEINPSGNVITTVSRPGNITDPGGNGVDYDVDHRDMPNTVLRVTSASLGDGVTGALGALGTIGGNYGTLTLNADGSYTYNVDSTNPAVIALAPGQTLNDVFTYEIVDTEGLTARSTLTIVVHGVQDPPVANNVSVVALEAGGVNNGTPGHDPSGDATVNSTDPDGDPITVDAIRTGAIDGTGTAGIVGQALAGRYGTITIQSDGTFTYVVDNLNATVQGLRTVFDIITDTFTFQITDGKGGFSSAQINVFILGQNDNPVANDVRVNAVEAGGVNNTSAGLDPSGSLISNDTDVDFNDTKTVTEFRTGPATGTGTDGVLGTELRGQYGWLTVLADGTYKYRVDNTMAAVQALRQDTDTLSENFTYTLSDLAGATDTATLTIVIHGRNDAPVANDDRATAIEAGGIANGTAGSNPSGNVLGNDSDVDQFGEQLRVTAFGRPGSSAQPGQSLAGTYGTLVINTDGTYTYTLDNSNAAVEALRTSSDTLTETFTYSISDLSGATSGASLTILITGTNDNPVAKDDTAEATEAGGVSNSIPGIWPTGNVLTNDTDVDANDTRTVDGIRAGLESAGGTFTSVTSGGTETIIAGVYGSLHISSTGAYRYELNENAANVQALVPGQTVTEAFTYRMHDTAGAQDSAQLVITIHGTNDAPVATTDVVTAAEAGGVNNGTPGLDPIGNINTNVSDVDGSALNRSVISISNGTATVVPGTEPLEGLYGQLRMRPDGTFQYVVDNNNAEVQALRTANDRLIDGFTYTVVDEYGATATSNIIVIIHGANDAPVAGDDIVDAFERGGVNNADQGVDPGGNVFRNDFDVDGVQYGETAHIVAVRTGQESGSGTSFTVGQEFRAIYGWATIQADGTASYRLDNNMPEVQALRTSSDTLTEYFTYTMADADGLMDSATVTVIIHGANDAPVAVNDTAQATEAGGVNNGTPGSNPSGNVIDNDSDVDGVQYGEHLSIATVSAIGGSSGSAGGAISGRFGTLTMDADGNYSYVLDNNNATVQALRTSNETLTEVFVYTLRDVAGATSQARLVITIRGANDNPVAVDDTTTAVEAGGLANATPGIDPSGNVLANDTDVDAGDTKTVNGIRLGTESSPGTLQAVGPGTTLAGQYGVLTIQPDGSYHYALDNSLPVVQALLPGQTLVETFTYQVVDTAGATDTAELRITIQGTNDVPVAVDDTATAIEAGGVHNQTPGVDPTGNVLDNDTDVDGVANGETKQVVDYVGAGGSASAGQAVAGSYGSLVIGADGSYQYVVNNDNPAVQALRTRADQLTDVFTYTMRDANGATSQAHLTITIQGANDNPVAANDSGTASDQTPAPQVTGNVLPNDSDVDAGDSLSVTGVRPGHETDSGTNTPAGQSLNGQYGTLVLNADGTYSYRIDLSNPTVLAAAGLGQVLHDVFTYTVADLAGATDTAELVITLDISAPYIPPGGDIEPIYMRDGGSGHSGQPLPQVQPVVFVGPEVRRVAAFNELRSLATNGTRIELLPGQGEPLTSIATGLGTVPGQYVSQAVTQSRHLSHQDLIEFLGRHGRMSLSADGMLADPSIFAATPKGMLHGEFLPTPKEARSARSFQDQLRHAARQRPSRSP